MSSEPIGYQYRFFDSPQTVTPGWSPWKNCNQGEYEDILTYISHGYRYEARKIYGGPIQRKHSYEIDENNDIISTPADPDPEPMRCVGKVMDTDLIKWYEKPKVWNDLYIKNEG